MSRGSRVTGRGSRVTGRGSRVTGRKSRSRSIASLLLLATMVACDPRTTRPDVVPFPDAQQIEVVLGQGDAITYLRNALLTDSFPLARFSAQDGWLEGPWIDRRTHRPVSSHHLGPDVVRLRAWSEPARPGNSTLIVELAWRPVADPSLPGRDLERSLVATDSLSLWLKGVLAQVDSQVGFHQPAAPAAKVH